MLIRVSIMEKQRLCCSTLKFDPKYHLRLYMGWRCPTGDETATSWSRGYGTSALYPCVTINLQRTVPCELQCDFQYGIQRCVCFGMRVTRTLWQYGEWRSDQLKSDYFRHCRWLSRVERLTPRFRWTPVDHWNVDQAKLKVMIMNQRYLYHLATLG